MQPAHVPHISPRILGCDKMNVTSGAKDIVINGTEPQEKQSGGGYVLI